jgi:cytoskeletal protein RodZ
MAIWPFNRNKTAADQKKVPREVEEYYQSERRDRVGVAWLLAALTLVVTVIIVLGLFLGGRWVYRKVANKDDNNTTQTTQTNQQAEQSPATTPQESSNSSSTNQPGNSNSSTNPSSNSSTTEDSNTQGTVNAPTQSNNPSSVSTQPTQTSSNLANTGPGETIAVFVLVSVAGYLGYSTYLRRRFN